MKATIIGGGIIGLSTAMYLREDGWEVTVLERGDLTDNCSFGNMGFLSPSHFVPLAQPGVVSQGILWMFDAKSPFYVRPELNWRLAQWGMQFVRSCNIRNVRKNMRPMLDLLLLSRDLTAAWRNLDGMSFEFARKGCINYFRTEKYEKSELENVKMGRDLGLDIEVLSGEQIRELEPDLTPDVRGGAWYRDDAHLYPNDLMPQLAAWLEKSGVRIIRRAEVTGFHKTGGKIDSVRYQVAGSDAPQKMSCDMAVIAAGSWSAELVRLAGDSLSLMPGKGYSMTVDVDHQWLRHPCILLEAKVAMTPWSKRLRIGSTMEIGAVNDRILMPRVEGILEAVPQYFPAYARNPEFAALTDKRTLREKVWYGFRPLSTDGMPYIGFARKTSNLMIATGHAMLGLSLAAGTGKLVAELAGGKTPSVDAAMFQPFRR